MQRDIIIGACIVFTAIVVAATLLFWDTGGITPIHRATAPKRAVAIDVPKPAPQPQRELPRPLAPSVAVTPLQPTTAPADPAWTGAPRGRRGPAAPAQPLTVPLAREALALVGADPAAEQVWATAINDPNFSNNARKDLIEDLNDQGYENLRNLTPNDLALVQSRLALIEQYAPDAMDQVNARAFAEAYKDLSNMLASGRGN